MTTFTIYAKILLSRYMKKFLIKGIIVLLLELKFPQNIRAQGSVTYLSNLGQASAGSVPVGSDSRLALIFFTGSNASGYTLDSVQLALAGASGNPKAFTALLYSMNPSIPIPGSSLGALNGSLSPVLSGIYSYVPASNAKLLPNAYYFVVLTAGTAVASGVYNLSIVGSNAYNPGGGWNSFGGVALISTDGSSWSGTAPGHPEFAINATAIPEPSTWALILLGGGISVLARRAFGRISRPSLVRNRR